MSANKHIDENGLDDLLRNYILEEKDAEQREAEAEFIFSQLYDVPVNGEKEAAMLKKLERGGTGFGGYKLFLSVLLFVLLVCVLINAIKTELKLLPVQNNERSQIPAGSGVPEITNNAELTPQIIKVRKPRDTFAQVTSIIQSYPNDTSSVIKTEVTEKPEIKSEPELPFLTEKDRIRFASVKKMMLSNLYGLDEKLYAHVIADKMEYAGKSLITDAYNMRTMGITNLEYKTFLADLLAQDRKEEYLKAQIQSGNWNAFGCVELSLTYFQSDRYNDFPVVNVSIEGAKLFCKWMEEELRIYVKQNKLKIKSYKVRLPQDYEWLYASRNGYTKIGFGDGYNTIFDRSEGLIDNSSVGRLKLIRKRVKRSDTLYDYIAVNHYGWNAQKLSELFNKALGYYDPSPSDTILPDRMKMYNKLAHVPEIVFEKKTGKLWLAGTSWSSKDEYQKFENEFSATGSSPFAGFRIVVINANDPDYKNPFP
jgi:hypothetical protein